MIGIGIDIENIERFSRKDILDNRTLLNKIYTKRELQYSFSKKNPSQHLAVRFAAKEAIFKACGSIGIFITDYKKIEILNNKRGVPIVHAHTTKVNRFDIKVSLSHCADKAMAFAFIST